MARIITSLPSYAYNSATLIAIKEDRAYLRQTLATTGSLEDEHTLHYGIRQLVSIGRQNREEINMWRAALERKSPPAEAPQKTKKQKTVCVRVRCCLQCRKLSQASSIGRNTTKARHPKRSASMLHTTQLTSIDLKVTETTPIKRKNNTTTNQSSMKHKWQKLLRVVESTR